ncbi:MAG: RHS repeat-associated core domain-containing protein, partial [Gemmatimonadota bacterium]
LTQDPIGLAGGVNLYAYAGNNPVAFSDPYGLCFGPLVVVCIAIGELLADVAVEHVVVAGAVAITAGIGTHELINRFSFAADATAYRPGAPFTPGTKGVIDAAADKATGVPGACEYCGIITVPIPGSPNSKEMDHLKSRKKGGDNSPDNGRRACRSCNRRFGPNDKADPRPPTPPEATESQ